MGIVAHSSFTQRGIEARKALLIRQAEIDERDIRRFGHCIRFDAKMRRTRMVEQAAARAAAANVAPRLYRPSLRLIMGRIAHAFGLHPNDIIGVNRNRRISFARQAFCYWARRMTGKSIVAIGRYVARNHSTVLRSIGEYTQKREEMGRHVRPLR